jgi:hypothetical protein
MTTTRVGGGGGDDPVGAQLVLTVLGETADTLVQLVKGHGVLEQLPAELGLVVDERDLLDLLGGGGGVELLGDGLAARVSQLGTGRWGQGGKRESGECGITHVEFLSSSRSLGAMVRKSQPARALISPVLRNEAPMTIVL